MEAAFHTAVFVIGASEALADRSIEGVVLRADAALDCCYGRSVELANVVVVSYNSRDELRGCVERFAFLEGLQVTVVDNASADGSADAVADLPIRLIRLPENRGFAYGCNVGWRADAAPFVLFLNPDATVDEGSVRILVAAAREAGVGAVAPRIVGSKGELEYSLRRFPRLRSTYAQALFIHRLLPRASWADESVRDADVYEHPGSPEWVSGACILVRRDVLEAIGGFDEGFFMYSEDIDLCRRIRDAGYDIRFEPKAVCVHHGGRSAPRAELLPVLARSRLRYARKHWPGWKVTLQRSGIALGAFMHMAFSTQGSSVRAGHRRAIRAVLPFGEDPGRMASPQTRERA